VEQIERTKNSFVDFTKTSSLGGERLSEPLLFNSIRASESQNKVFYESRGGLCYNMNLIWNYTPSTQEQLKLFLCSDSERLSTFMGKVEKNFQRDTLAKPLQNKASGGGVNNLL